MDRIVTTCDSCGEEKKETNHWFKVVVSLRGSFCLLPYKPKLEKTRQIADACGETCALKILSRWIQTGKLLAEKLPKSAPAVTQAMLDTGLAVERPAFGPATPEVIPPSDSYAGDEIPKPQQTSDEDILSW